MKRYLERSIYSHPVINKIIKKRKNEDVFLVGGSIRDFLIGRRVSDVDIAVSGSGKLFASKIGRCFKLKEEFDEWRVVLNNYTVDVLGLGDKSIEEDLTRRDFTINAMAYDLTNGKFYDPLKGVEDIQRKIIRVSREKNILDDPLRILRGLRLSVALNFEIERETKFLFVRYAQNLNSSAPERIRQELLLMFSEDNSYRGVLPNVFDIIFPGFIKMEEIGGGRGTNITLLEHSILTVKKLEELIRNIKPFKKFENKMRPYLENKLPLLKIAALLHDIKKPETISYDDTGSVHFYGHEEKGAEWFRKRGKELKFSKKEIDYISMIIGNHMWIHLLSTQEILTERAKRRIIFRLGEDIMGLILFSFADAEASNGRTTEKVIYTGNEILKYYFHKKKDIRQIIMGKDLIKYLGLTPGPYFGEILKMVQTAYEEGDIRTKKEAVELAKRIVKERYKNSNLSNNLRSKS